MSNSKLIQQLIIGSIFILLGVLGILDFTLYLTRHLEIKGWEPVEAELQYIRYEFQSNGHGTNVTLDVRYSYVYEDVSYSGDKTVNHPVWWSSKHLVDYFIKLSETFYAEKRTGSAYSRDRISLSSQTEFNSDDYIFYKKRYPAKDIYKDKGIRPFVCYVDPYDPYESVLFRENSMSSINFVGLWVGLVLLGTVGVVVWGLWRMKKNKDSEDW